MEQAMVYILKTFILCGLVLVFIKALEMLHRYSTKPDTQTIEQQVNNLIAQQEYFNATLKVINEAHSLPTAEFAKLLDKVNQAIDTATPTAQEVSPISLARSALSKSNTVELYIGDSKVLIIHIDPTRPAYRTYNTVTDEILMHTHCNNRAVMYDSIIDILCTQYKENDNVSVVAISSMLERTDVTSIIAKIVSPIQEKKNKDNLIIT